MAKFFARARTIIAKIRANPAAQTLMRALASCLAFCGRHGFAAIAWLGLFAIAAFVWMVFEHREPIVKFAEAIGYAGAEGMEGSTRFIRDTMIFGAGAFGIMVAIWRASILGSQAKTAEKRLLNEQFANAVELMAKETTGANPKPAIAARIGGIYTMADLAMKRPAEFAELVVKNLIAYIKDNAQLTATPELKERKTPDKPRKLGGDVQAAFLALSSILGNKEINIDEGTLDFSQTDFFGLDLSGTDLQHYKKWTRADFRRCGLVGVHFKDADMQWGDFSNANLRGASLENVIMNFAIMKEADLTEITMADVDLTSADLRGAVLIKTIKAGFITMSFARMQGCYMREPDLQKASLNGAKLMGAYLEFVPLNGANMTGANLQGAIFSGELCGADLRGASFGATDMRWANFKNDQLPEQVKQAMNGRIWHSAGPRDTPWRNGIEQHSSDANSLPAILEDGYALAGFLANFAKAPEYTKECRLLITGQGPVLNLEEIQRRAATFNPEHIPEDTPEATKAWLKEIKAKYYEK